MRRFQIDPCPPLPFRVRVLVLLVLAAVPALAQDTAPAVPPPDRLEEALALAGFTREDLGYRPKGYWSRYPNPAQMPYKLPFFDDLFAEPLRVYDFTRVMTMTVDAFLAPDKLAAEGQALYKLAYFLGVDRKITGFRSYGANLDPRLDEQAPLAGAVARVYDAVGAQLTVSTFGLAPGQSWRKWDDDARAELKAAAERLPETLQRPVAALVLNVLDAYLWRQRALRNVDGDDLRRVFAIRDLPDTHSGSRVYHFEIDDLARDLDEYSLYYAGMKAVQAADDARRALSEALAEEALSLEGAAFDFLTPIGRIVVAGTAADTHAWRDAVILVDLGGNDRYTGPVAATTSPDLPVSIAIDCGGDDLYECVDDRDPCQGAGILGVGILVDDAGNDTYKAASHAQGVGLFGLGMLFDRAGDDTYTMTLAGQGAGYFGLGYHIDCSGNDTFYFHGDGQGYGGPGGVGVLLNYEGDDRYTAEPYAEKAGRPDYHSQGKIAISQAQGVGAGRRGDGADGHNWAGGLGVLIDMTGSDRYESGNFSAGLGYWYGTGLLYDGEGDDVYRSVYFTQASGAHFCIGALIDEGGNDVHELFETAGAGLCFGWDFTVALLLNKGGNDRYEARGKALGVADIRSNALFIDIGGNDTYLSGTQASRGAAPFQESYRALSYHYGPYNYYANSFALLLDIGGTDRYLDMKGKQDPVPSETCADNRTWQHPGPSDENYGFRNYGIGMDVETGRVPDFTTGISP